MEEILNAHSNHEFNLSDFALFLSVMKNPKAYRAVLSIFMEEPDIELIEVKVEQVILNKIGKRAIRLDAWAKSIDNRQFNMEMQNDTAGDDVRKRSRFYQSMIDTPVLKSGKETRYKNLPSTVIIFITQEDIFGKDLAKYTFVWDLGDFGIALMTIFNMIVLIPMSSEAFKSLKDYEQQIKIRKKQK